MTFEDTVEKVAINLWWYYRKNRGKWELEDYDVKQVYLNKATEILQMAYEPVRNYVISIRYDEQPTFEEVEKYVEDLLKMTKPQPQDDRRGKIYEAVKKQLIKEGIEPAHRVWTAKAITNAIMKTLFGGEGE